jgi:hypothetical protein
MAKTLFLQGRLALSGRHASKFSTVNEKGHTVSAPGGAQKSVPLNQYLSWPHLHHCMRASPGSQVLGMFFSTPCQARSMHSRETC